jgi:hypothetical protein
MNEAAMVGAGTDDVNRGFVLAGAKQELDKQAAAPSNSVANIGIKGALLSLPCHTSLAPTEGIQMKQKRIRMAAR